MQDELHGLAPKLVCFNLGYLPFTDKTIMTLPDTTVAAINVALEVLDSDGALSIISYVGHEGSLPAEKKQLSCINRRQQCGPRRCDSLERFYSYYKHRSDR